MKFADELPKMARGQGRPSKYDPLYEELKRHPRQWGEVYVTKSRSQASAVAQTFKQRFGCKAATRGNPDGTTSVWAKTLAVEVEAGSE
jgi:hypothetical protein